LTKDDAILFTTVVSKEIQDPFEREEILDNLGTEVLSIKDKGDRERCRVFTESTWSKELLKWLMQSRVKHADKNNFLLSIRRSILRYQNRPQCSWFILNNDIDNKAGM